MSFQFRPAKREQVGLLIGLAGGTGSGKTYTAMLLARGLAAGKPFAVIDTEAGRAKHYAGEFQFDHGDLKPPFNPAAYAEAIAAADAAGYPVIVVDSMSHEHAGDGGLLDMHEAELRRMAGDDWKKREQVTFAAWVKPKGDHKRMVSKLLQVRAHLILCFRAEEKIEIVKEGGKTKVVPKPSLVGLDGWVPVAEKTLPYELTISFLLTAAQPGVPKPIKLQAQHRPFFPLDKPISEDAGRALGEWAAGGEAPLAGPEVSSEEWPIAVREEVGRLVTLLLAHADELDARDSVQKAINKNREGHAGDPAAHIAWLQSQIERAAAASRPSGGSGDGDGDGDGDGAAAAGIVERAAEAQRRRGEAA